MGENATFDRDDWEDEAVAAILGALEGLTAGNIAYATAIACGQMLGSMPASKRIAAQRRTEMFATIRHFEAQTREERRHVQ